MKPDEKYMSELKINDDDINFVPPAFTTSLFRNNCCWCNKNDLENLNNDNFSTKKPDENTNNNNMLNLFPSETEESQLYCYYDSINDCNKENSDIIENNDIPTPCEILRNFDLDLDETTDLLRHHSSNDVDKIFSKIEKRNPGILATFSSYRIPYPIAMVIIKRIIKLSLLYSDKKDR